MADLGLSYEEAMHGVQSAIAYEMGQAVVNGHRHPPTEPKHLRVGVDGSKSDQGGLATLLIEKGVFTLEEYQEAMRLAANEELYKYQAMYGVTFG
jgi:hypothetical protein